MDPPLLMPGAVNIGDPLQMPAKGARAGRASDRCDGGRASATSPIGLTGGDRVCGWRNQGGRMTRR